MVSPAIENEVRTGPELGGASREVEGSSHSLPVRRKLQEMVAEALRRREYGMLESVGLTRFEEEMRE